MDNSRIRNAESEAPCFIDSPADLAYLTGLNLSKGRLFLKTGGTILFVDGRYFEKAKELAPCEVRIWDEQDAILEAKIAFDSSFLTYAEYQLLKNKFKDAELIPLKNPLKNLRAIKDECEIAALKKAAKLTFHGYQEITKHLKEGVTEEALALEFEIFVRKNGASHLSFDPIIAFGENGAYPHYRAGPVKLKNGQSVLIDVGAVVDGYAGDMTRLAYFGKPDEKVVRLEKMVREAQKKAIDAIQPGVRIGELDQIVQDAFETQNVKQLYTHSLGHGIGLETHEFPRISYKGEDKDLILEPGMVFTVEPGLYQVGVGGVRIEDMVLVTDSGCEILSVGD